MGGRDDVTKKHSFSLLTSQTYAHTHTHTHTLTHILSLTHSPPSSSRQDVGLYREVKLYSDTMIGIPSQCFVADKAGVGQVCVCVCARACVHV